LAFGLEWDRDYFVDFAKMFRECYWPISVFIIHPFTIFVLIRKSPMDLDCKIAFVVHHIVLMCFDYYNGALYQTGLAFCTISLCVPYLFIMLRMHQKMQIHDGPFRVNDRLDMTVEPLNKLEVLKVRIGWT
ncbi:hypothetical protein PENTCL1PPCAC_15915, partial [Pristionchus entomophagus]